VIQVILYSLLDMFVLSYNNGPALITSALEGRTHTERTVESTSSPLPFS